MQKSPEEQKMIRTDQEPDFPQLNFDYNSDGSDPFASEGSVKFDQKSINSREDSKLRG